MSKKNIIMNILIIIGMILSYLILDLGIRYITYDNYQFYSYTLFAPSLFSLGWISLFIGIFYLLNKKYRRIFYLINLIIFNLICYSQYLHFKNQDRFYNISDLFLTKEGFSYFNYALKKSDIKIFIIITISLILGLLIFIISKKYHEQHRDKLYFSFVIIFTTLCISGFFICAHFRLGREENESSSYSASTDALSVYNDFNNPNKNMQVVGLYENLYRGIYIYIKDRLNDNSNIALKEVEDYLTKNNKELEPNEYTGIFKDKNIIFILMESIDDFLINDEIMPTLTKLQKEGFNFTNRYSPSFGGGQTINSEFAVNTGLYSSNDSNIYNLDNTYKNSLANSFKNIGYDTASIHFNNGYYYNRTEFHKNLGYSKHYSLLDMENIDNNKYNYEFDSNLIKNNKVYNLIVRNNKYLSFITTYSAHLPYDSSNKRCSYNVYGFNETNIELLCIDNMAHDTDEMLRLLIEKLEKENKLDDTVLVLAADHYMYGYNNVVSKKKTSNKYLLQHTPFIIWSNTIKNAQEITNLVDTADILPTILNMFGIDYNPNTYVGEDAFSQNREEYIYFNEDVYYDGKNIYDEHNTSNNKDIYNKIKSKINFNNNLIKSNYLKIK